MSNRKLYNASFIAWFSTLALCAFLRLLVYWGAFDFAAAWGGDALDYVFTFFAQIIALGLLPLLMLRFIGKKNVPQTAEHLRVVKPKPYIFLAFAIGFFGFFANYAMSFSWTLFLSAFGYNSAGGDFTIHTFPQFLLAVIFVAVLPAVCEEITHRGMLLRAQEAARASEARIIFMGGLFFGLFHMSIGQTFYTAAMGCAMVFMTLKSKSILPAVIMHFTNNFMNVYLEFAYTNGLFGKGFYSALTNASSNLGAAMGVLALCFLCVPVVIGGLYLFLARARKAGDAPPPKPKVYPRPYPAYVIPYPPNGRNAVYGSAYGFPPQGAPQNVGGGDPVYGARYGAPYTGEPYSGEPYSGEPGTGEEFGGNAAAPPPAYGSGWIPPENAAPARETPGGADAPPNEGWQVLENPDAVEITAPSFKPSVKDEIFKYASVLFAAGVTVVSFLFRL